MKFSLIMARKQEIASAIHHNDGSQDHTAASSYKER